MTARLALLASPRTRRRRPAKAVSRGITFGPAVAVPAWGWAQLGQPEHLAGLAVFLVLGLWLIPAAVVVLLFFGPRSLPALVPRQQRKKYRHRRPREEQRSSRISKFQRRVCYAADRYKCAYCRVRYSQGELNCDHYLPWSQGGLTVLLNLVTLCRACNVTKSNYWPGVHYRPVEGSDNLALAIAILAAERRHRFNPLRLTRAAWALGA